MSTRTDMEALFASITDRQNQRQRQQQQQPQAHPHPSANAFSRQPSVSSPLFSPSARATPPHHGSDVISPNVPTPQGEISQPQTLNADQTSQLLNILKVNQQPSNPATPKREESATPPDAAKQEEAAGGEQGGSGHSRGISASDLMASFMPKPSAKPGETAPVSAQKGGYGPAERSSQSTPADDPQEMLLRLLTRPKPQETAQPAESANGPETSPTAPTSTEAEAKRDTAASTDKTNAAAGISKGKAVEEPKSPAFRTFGTEDSRKIQFELPNTQKTSQESMFTYVNPFEQLAASRASPPAKTAEPKESPSTPGPSTEAKKPQAQPAAAFQQASPETSSKTPAAPEAEVVAESKLKPKETVPEALEGVAEKVDMEADAALARAATEKKATTKKQKEVPPSATTNKGDEASRDAIPVKQSDKEPDSGADKAKGKGEAAAATATGGDVVDSWETEAERIVPVYSFPMKPFVSITWKRTDSPEASVRDDGVLPIAKLKKSFNQLDRSLTSATSGYIVYALAKNGGMRVIRQSDGQDRRVFYSSGDRVFNVTICQEVPASGSPVKDEAVLGTAESGTAYWAPITKGDDDLFERDALDSEGLIFPPFPASDENTSGGQLKTRVRRSSRNPDFFAIGRGKSIYIVWPQAAMSHRFAVPGSQQKVDTERLFKEKSLKISPGKAGKDFAFSDDDTVIVSLDKTGRIKFWDIRQVSKDMSSTAPQAAEIRVPLLTLATGSPNEKSWPTSIIFLDKHRPYAKRCALRYVLIGLKQNHTLQLWDIGLGKAVQELNFPHSNECDGICSIAYHAASGIVVVGHPTRNSVYFIHLSTPRYPLSPMSQGAYVQGAADKDPQIPRPESTACMSGIRELSLSSGNVGELRSLELLPLSKNAAAQHGFEESGHSLFELYVMHSRGVTSLTITKADLGWDIDNKTLKRIDSLEKGYIDIKGLESPPSQLDEQPASRSTNGDTTLHPPAMSEKDKETPSGAERSGTQSPTKEAKKSKKKGAAGTTPKPRETANEGKPVEEAGRRDVPVQKPVIISKGDEKKSEEKQAAAESSRDREAAAVPKGGDISATAANLDMSADVLRKEVKRMEDTLTLEFSKSFNRELDTVYRRFDEDRRSQNETAIERQDAMLRLVSSTLSDNVEKNLSRIVASSIESTVVPAVASTATASIDKQINETVAKQLDSIVSRSINSALPEIVSRTLQASDVQKSFSDVAAPLIVSRAEGEFTSVMLNKVVPAFKREYLESTGRVVNEVEQRFASKFREYETQQASDSAKIDHLTGLVRTLSDTVASMAASQSSFQSEILSITQDAHSKTDAAQDTAAAVSPPAEARQPAQASPEEIELAEITQLMGQGQYEDASIKVRFPASFLLQSFNHGPY